MSEVASLVPFGAFHSAWYYRDLFLRDETKHDKFWCPFCGIQVLAILIYKPAEEELARSPHFREKEPHRHGCDGNPAKGGKLPVAEGPVRKIEKQLFTLPARLIEYIEPREQVSRPSRIERTAEPSPDKVKRRRVDAGEMHHRARFSVSLVQSLAEAHLGTIRQSYQLRETKSGRKSQSCQPDSIPLAVVEYATKVADTMGVIQSALALFGAAPVNAAVHTHVEEAVPPTNFAESDHDNNAAATVDTIGGKKQRRSHERYLRLPCLDLPILLND